jgi:hypothetical protein
MKLASAPSKPALEELINEYFYSSSYFINSENHIESLTTMQLLSGFTVTQKKGRWIFSNSL